jgi:HK97 family phage major capsid protein
MRIFLKKWHGRLEAMLGTGAQLAPVGMTGSVGYRTLVALSAPLFIALLVVALVIAWLFAGGSIGPESLYAAPLVGLTTATAPSKNREANELRTRAEAVLKKIGDPNEKMNEEEFNASMSEHRALVARANLLDEISPDKEIERQGGDGNETVKIPSRENITADIPTTLRGKVDAFRKSVQKHFGGTANYCRAAKGHIQNLTGPQQAVLGEAKMLTRTIVGTASDASGGEFLLPLEQEQAIFRIDNTIPGILQRARLYSMKGRTKRIPALVQTNEHLTRPLSSISAISIVGEAGTKPTHEPTFEQRLLTAYKYAAISKIGDETIDDDFTGDLEPALIQSVGQEVLNQMNFHCTISGTGSSMPTGALYTSQGALLKVTRTTQNRIKFADVVNMYTRHTHGPNSFWIISRRAIGELFQMELSSGSGVTYLAGMAIDPSKVPLLGYPIVISDFMNALGEEGDIGLINPDFYAAALRRQLTVESSIHPGFVDDVTTWRFFARGGGIPIPTAPYAYRSVASSNVDEHSPFVVLDDVYA